MKILDLQNNTHVKEISSCPAPQDLSTMAFHFKDKESPRVYTSALAGKLQQFPIQDVLSGHSLFDTFCPDLINSILVKLVPENMR